MEGWRVWVTRRQQRSFWLSFFLQLHPWSSIYPNPAKKPQNPPHWRRVWITRHHVRCVFGAHLLFSSLVAADLHAGGLFVGHRRRVGILSSFGFSAKVHRPRQGWGGDMSREKKSQNSHKTVRESGCWWSFVLHISAMAATWLNEGTSTVKVAVVVSTPKAQERSSVLHFLALASKGILRGEREEFLFGGQEEERGADGIERRERVFRINKREGEAQFSGPVFWPKFWFWTVFLFGPVYFLSYFNNMGQAVFDCFGSNFFLVIVV